MPAHRGLNEAAFPDPGDAASRMSARHGWLHFSVSPRALSWTIHRFDTDAHSVREWRAVVAAGLGAGSAGSSRPYAAPPQVAGAFVLQYALGVWAATLAGAAAAGPFAVGVDAVSFDLAPGGHPDRVRLARVTSAADDSPARAVAAHTAYLDSVTDVALRHDAGVHLGRHQRLGMVADAWGLAARDVGLAGSEGTARRGVVEREACCYLYAVPGCHECAGCPRLRRPGQPGTS